LVPNLPLELAFEERYRFLVKHVFHVLTEDRRSPRDLSQ
jgi:hypothetical protein